MHPSVKLPDDVPTPLDVALKPGWTFDSRRRLFRADAGDATFSPTSQLPSGTRILHKVPDLARRAASSLSLAEQDLRRYVQVILPKDQKPAKFLQAVRAWPVVESAAVAPRPELPGQL